MPPKLGTIAEFQDLEPELEDFEDAVLRGLGGQPKTLPCKFLYDQRGSQLFDKICDLAEYYPTRTEIALLDRYKDDIASHMGENCHLIEFGSGSSIKIRILLRAVLGLAAYSAVDISKDHLLAATAKLAADFPHITVTAVCADYTQPFEISPPQGNPDTKRVGFFPGSTIGNFTPNEAIRFLERAAGMLMRGGEMLMGVDLKKNVSLLEAAYDDSEGVTAEFNLNLLRRINRELAGSFDLRTFQHRSVYNAQMGRVEMHLVSLRDQSVSVAGRTFRFKEEESIHTENSCKYTVGEFHEIANRAGFEPVTVWIDDDNLFSVHYLRVT